MMERDKILRLPMCYSETVAIYKLKAMFDTPMQEDTSEPCPNCNATGKVLLLQFEHDCETCSGTGRTQAETD